MVGNSKARVKCYKTTFSSHPQIEETHQEGNGEENRTTLMEFQWSLFLVFKNKQAQKRDLQNSEQLEDK